MMGRWKNRDHDETRQRGHEDAGSMIEGPRTIGDLQRHLDALYGPKDRARGDAGCFLWLVEEIGELAGALRTADDDALAAEMADVLAWLATVANVRGIDLDRAVWQKYGTACPGCGAVPCACDPADKP
jgi:NTP pyrophosphatase (non-canonical NTP hydrolase)